MAKREKKLKKWEENPPKEAPIDEVNAIIEYHFPGILDNKKRGSHSVRIKNKALIGKQNFGPDGGFDVPIKGGQKVKGIYLQKLAIAIKILQEIEEETK